MGRGLARSLVLGMLISLSACTSYFLRKSCEDKNWYQYGFDLAMRGKRINNDDYILQCRKVEAEISESQLDTGFKAGMANYCKPEIVFQTGKNGEALNLDFCDPGQVKILQSRHAEGVKVYCEPQNGFRLGTAGKAYSKICPTDLEKLFLPEFQKGRKRYLQAMVSETQSKISDLERRAFDKDREIRSLQMQLAMVPPPREVISRTMTPNGIVEESKTEDLYADRRNQLSNNIRMQESESRDMQNKQLSLKEKLFDYQRELQTLGE